ncbi:unnamed protein product [Staurois parvus]|uniref:Secreted protein n=1 Tax=Staurois parvus TaxID=386267 RepID=A0ABN9HF68_9NEOB|nr:unnamed protein product [Staurois parvus]
MTGSTAGLHWWVALVGSTGGWAQVGTCRWHFWAQVGGTAEWHRWALVGTGGGTAGRHRWAELVCGTAGHRPSGHFTISDPDDRCRSPPIPALTTAGFRQYFPHDLTA